jgi:hypothetical protein
MHWLAGEPNYRTAVSAALDAMGQAEFRVAKRRPLRVRLPFTAAPVGYWMRVSLARERLGMNRATLGRQIRNGLHPCFPDPVDGQSSRVVLIAECRPGLKKKWGGWAGNGVRALVAGKLGDALRALKKSGGLAVLTPRQRKVLQYRFGLGGDRDWPELIPARPHTLEEVGVQFAVTRERVRQIEKQALAELRKKGLL